MSYLRFTLLSDGSSDRALMPILTRLLEENYPNISTQGNWADLRFLKAAPPSLAERIRTAIELYPCDLLFVHRDAERESLESRRNEIRDALESLWKQGFDRVPSVCVVPVRMQEAWLLVDEKAIRTASGNPDGQMKLNLPRLNRLEDTADPKELLFQALRTASGHSGRKLKKLRVNALRHRVAELMENISVLRQLSAFASLENELATVRRLIVLYSEPD